MILRLGLLLGLLGFAQGALACTTTVNNTLLASGSTGNITDSACNVWTVPTSNGAAQLNGATISGSSNVTQLAYVNGTVWQQAPTNWNPLVLTTPSSGPQVAQIGPAFALSPLQTNWWINPGQDGYYWKLPFQTTATWTTSGSNITALRNGTHSQPYASVNLVGNFARPFYLAQGSDPVVTVTLGSTSFQTHLPLGAVTEAPYNTTTDSAIGATDQSQPGLSWSMSGVTMTVGGNQVTSVQASGTVLTGTYGLQRDWAFGPYMVDAVTGQQGDGNAYGWIQDYELSQANASSTYVIPHTLQVQLDNSQVNTSIVWPLEVADQSFPFVGPLPQGQTYGIPASTPRPSGMTRGQALMFDTFQQMGALVYNFGATGGMNLGIYSTNSANSALVTDIVNNAIEGGGPGGSSWLMQYICILNNQTGLASQKGQVGGVRSDAFTAPPLLSLAPTSGREIPSTNVNAYTPTTTSGYSSASGGYTAPAPLIVGPASMNLSLGTVTSVPGVAVHEVWYPSDTMSFTAYVSGSAHLNATGATGNGTNTLTFSGTVAATNTMLGTLTVTDGATEMVNLVMVTSDAHSESYFAATSISAGDNCPASANNTVLTGGTTGVITDSNGNAWGLPHSGQMVFLQGSALPATQLLPATELAYVNNVVWMENTSNQWYSFNSSGGIASGPTTSPLQLTITAPANLAANINVATSVPSVSVGDAANPGDIMSFTGSSTLQGKLSATGATGNGTGTITFSGSLTALNAALATLNFTDAVAENPTISYSVSDQHSLTASTTTAVTVTNPTPPSTGTTWNPAAIGNSGTLSNGNLTMVTTGSTNVLSTSSKTPSNGKVCFGVTANALSYNWAAGLATASQGLTGVYLGGGGTPSEGLYANYGGSQTVFISGTNAANIPGGTAVSSPGDIILEAVDFSSGLFWVTDAAMRAAGFPWNDSTTATPIGEVGGLSLSALGPGPYFIAAGAQEAGSSFTINPVPTGCPTGFPTWDQSIPTGVGPWTTTLQ